MKLISSLGLLFALARTSNCFTPFLRHRTGRTFVPTTTPSNKNDFRCSVPLMMATTNSNSTNSNSGSRARDTLDKFKKSSDTSRFLDERGEVCVLNRTFLGLYPSCRRNWLLVCFLCLRLCQNYRNYLDEMYVYSFLPFSYFS
jgi:hypothetical protein